MNMDKHKKLADLQLTQLEKLRELEKKWSVTLIAYQDEFGREEKKD